MAAFIAAGMGLVYAELGTAYPIAGGEYAIIGRVLGRGTGFVVFVILLLFYTLLIASFALGAGIQLQTIWHSGRPPHDRLVLLALAASCLAVLRDQNELDRDDGHARRSSWSPSASSASWASRTPTIPSDACLSPKAFIPSGAAGADHVVRSCWWASRWPSST